MPNLKYHFFIYILMCWVIVLFESVNYIVDIIVIDNCVLSYRVGEYSTSR
jgi:hypothetical protein